MFDVVVVGSGYGGSTVAARLSERFRVLLVEKGRRWRPEDLPAGILGLVRSYRTERAHPDGLWAMRFGKGTGNAQVSALGGASLVNYGITMRPADHVLASWPLPAGELNTAFAKALAVLAPLPAPVADFLGDKAFLDLVEPGRRIDIENTIDWSRCDYCGTCVPGCRRGAKRSLDMTYLAAAETNGAEVRPETEVMDFTPLPSGGYEIVLARTGRPSESELVRTRTLVLAAGTFGTLDLLNRTRLRIPVSPLFGKRMSMNGDAFAFLYNTSHPLSGHHGAPITTSVRLLADGPEGRPLTLTVMSGRVPAAIARFSAMLLAIAGGVLGHRVNANGSDLISRRARRRIKDLFGVKEGGALSQSFMYKLTGEDQGQGEARFVGGRAVLDWPGYAHDPIHTFAARRLEEWAARIGGTVITDPGTWPGGRSFGVHPLGGCRIGRTYEDGVVDDLCRVFRPDGGCYPGLRIVGAPVLPSAPGVPPSLTITAIAERAAEDMERELSCELVSSCAEA
ncbi:MAG: GMC family oxidoreductase [Planctomycetes bacterium]|nr:GMC family oxidoreductase [Planctomycetota bacterium]